MGFNYFTENFDNFSEDFEPRNTSKEVWKDLLIYSSNLSGNWHLSKHVFYHCIVPTAQKNPAQFAYWVKDMVKQSGIKIKSKSEFKEAILFLTKSKHDNRNQIKKALYYLLDSGLDEPIYASKALKKNHA